MTENLTDKAFSLPAGTKLHFSNAGKIEPLIFVSAPEYKSACPRCGDIAPLIEFRSGEEVEKLCNKCLAEVMPRIIAALHKVIKSDRGEA
jgi:hypothetical protein